MNEGNFTLDGDDHNDVHLWCRDCHEYVDYYGAHVSLSEINKAASRHWYLYHAN